MLLDIEKLDMLNKRVLIRLDLNVPIKNGVILSNARIIASIPTIKLVINKGANVILTSHLGRPKEGIYNNNFSLLPICKELENILNINIKFIKNYFGNNNLNLNKINEKIIMLENVRFNKGECKNSKFLSKYYSTLCDIFIMDAFATSHRKHSSTYGICKYCKISCIGLLFKKEINFLSKIMSNPKRPMVSIVGGCKISTKFNFLNSLAKISDSLIVGGGISNTFIAIDYNIGKSLYEPNYINLARKLRDKYNIPLPLDCRVGKNFSELSKSYVKKLNDISYDDEIMDLGDLTINLFYNIILKANTILWNGPVGVFEFPNFRKGTEKISKAIVKSNAFVVAGGGDTISAIELFGIKDKISYISTGGGAFLKFIEDKTLPILNILDN